MRPQRWQPPRLPRPWDSPGKNTGVGCHFLQCMKVKSESEVAQSCLTPSDPMDCSPPGSSAHGILQARALEWVPLPPPTTMLLGYSNQSSTALAQKQTCGSVELNRRPEINPHPYRQLIFSKGGKNILWGKDSLFSEWYCESWTAACTKNNLEMAERWQDTIKLRGEHRQSILWHTCYQCFLGLASQGNRNKNKNKQMGTIQTYNSFIPKETINKTNRQPMD